jgi:hypothetical protein
MLLGQKAGDVVGTVVDVAKRTFGSDDPAVIADAAKNDPNLVALYIERVKAETAQFLASIEDTKDARAQTIKLVEAGSSIAWGAPTISIIVTVGFVAVLTLWMLHPPSSEPATINVLSILIGSLGASFVQVCNYWLGSSAGSAAKDKLLLAATPPGK